MLNECAFITQQFILYFAALTIMYQRYLSMATEMFHHKILFIGPAGCGKSTAIRAYSEIETVDTDVKTTEADVAKIKEMTTVALDYGAVVLDEETKIHLYGTPGQERFEFMWDILGEGSNGIVILMDHTDPDPLERLKFYVEKFHDFLEKVPAVIGINKFDSPTTNNLTYDDYKAAIAKLGFENIPVYEVDMRKEDDVRFLVMTLLFSTPLSLQEEIKPVENTDKQAT